MTTKITTDLLVKSILAAKDKGGLAATIARLTQGEAISEGVVASVGAKLTETYVAPTTDEKQRDARARMVAGIVDTLKAARVLPVILKEAETLFPKDGPRRDGNKAKAIRAGITCYLEKPDRNDLSVKIAEAVPLMSGDDARSREVAAIRNALDALITRMGKVGVNADAVKAINAASALVK